MEIKIHLREMCNQIQFQVLQTCHLQSMWSWIFHDSQVLILLAGFTKLTNILGITKTPTEKKLLIASIHMELEALIWF